MSDRIEPLGGGYAGLQTDDGYMDASDPVCPHCGRFAVWEDCHMCGGEGEFDAYEDDPLWYDPGHTTWLQGVGNGPHRKEVVRLRIDWRTTLRKRPEVQSE